MTNVNRISKADPVERMSLEIKFQYTDVEIRIFNIFYLFSFCNTISLVTVILYQNQIKEDDAAQRKMMRNAYKISVGKPNLIGRGVLENQKKNSKIVL